MGMRYARATITLNESVSTHRPCESHPAPRGNAPFRKGTDRRFYSLAAARRLSRGREVHLFPERDDRVDAETFRRRLRRRLLHDSRRREAQRMARAQGRRAGRSEEDTPELP